MKNCFLIVFLVFSYSLVKGQSVENSSIVYDQFVKNYFLLNPSLLHVDNRFDISLGNRTLTGLFEGVNRFYADAHILSDCKKENRYHAFGLQALSNRDGEYFSKSRVYLRYSWSTALTEYSSLSAGASIGLINFTYKASPAGGGGSSFAPDANFGLWYSREKLKLGISYQQITRPVLKPVNQETRLDDYINFNAIHLLNFNEDIYMETNLYYMYHPVVPLNLELAPVITFLEKVETGFNYRHQKGVAIMAGLKSIAIGSNHFRFMASYLFSTRRLTTFNDGVLEFSFGYSLLK